MAAQHSRGRHAWGWERAAEGLRAAGAGTGRSTARGLRAGREGRRGRQPTHARKVQRKRKAKPKLIP